MSVQIMHRTYKSGQVRLVLAEGVLRRAGRVRTLADLRIHLGIDLRVALLGDTRLIEMGRFDPSDLFVRGPDVFGARRQVGAA